jgi:uncharacterized protein (UPF0276 family)
MDSINECGLGLRKEFIFELQKAKFRPNWLEITPENWIQMPVEYRDVFDELALTYPMVAHGLSLSIGSSTPLDKAFLTTLKTFFQRYNIKHYSEHLSFSSLENKQTYELLPLPMTKKVVSRVVDRIKMVQDYLQMPLILENATYYYVPKATMAEHDFINEVITRSGAKMLLDVNNVYVNAKNHGFNAKKFIKNLALDHVAYMHIAGHEFFEEDDMIIDTHGEKVIKEVYDLLRFTLKRVQAPVLLERDNNVPNLKQMQKEFTRLENVAKPFFSGGVS